MIHSVSN